MLLLTKSLFHGISRLGLVLKRRLVFPLNFAKAYQTLTKEKKNLLQRRLFDSCHWCRSLHIWIKNKWLTLSAPLVQLLDSVLFRSWISSLLQAVKVYIYICNFYSIFRILFVLPTHEYLFPEGWSLNNKDYSLSWFAHILLAPETKSECCRTGICSSLKVSDTY